VSAEPGVNRVVLGPVRQYCRTIDEQAGVGAQGFENRADRPKADMLSGSGLDACQGRR